MKVRILPLFLIILFTLVFFVFYKGLQNTNIYTPNFKINEKIPDFRAKIFNTEDMIDSKELFKTDKFYLLNIWASWCLPCRDEHYLLLKLKEETNLKIIGLNYKDKKVNAESFLNELKNPYHVILEDEKGIISIELGAYGVPETFLIHNKKIIKKIIGPLNKKYLIEIKKFIK
tara:strand:+ start:543 stop:1061 length:519 start_codon:yes stop_codon:yes gene_type:complete